MVRLSAPIVCPGLFYAVSAQDGSLFRLRIPGGVLTSSQARAIAALATELSGGEVQVTNRANLQIRAGNSPIPGAVLAQLQKLGLAGPIAALDHLRNILASPTAGIDPQAAIDTRPLVRDLDHYISTQPKLAGLPPKFSVGLDGGEALSIVDRPNDLIFTAVFQDTAPAFRLALNMGKGGQRLDLGVLVRPDAIVPVVAALAEVYLQHESPLRDEAGKPPRLRQLLQHWGAAWYLGQMERVLGRVLERSPLEPENAFNSDYLHLGAHPQRQPGLSYLGVIVPLGRLSEEQLTGLADLAEQYGSGTLRLTPWQNVLIPDVPRLRVGELRAVIAPLNLPTAANHPAGAIVACAGSPGCRASATDTQAHAQWLMAELAQRVKLDRPLNLHLSGCPKSCAQPNSSDIALLGIDPEHYRVYVGTGEQPFGQELGLLPLKKIPALLEQMVQLYQQNRSPEESFRAFADRALPQLLELT